MNLPKDNNEFACMLDASIAAAWTALGLVIKTEEDWVVFVDCTKQRLRDQGFDDKTIDKALEFTSTILDEIKKREEK